MGWVRRWGPWLELDPYLPPFLKRVRYPHPSSRAGQSDRPAFVWTRVINLGPQTVKVNPVNPNRPNPNCKSSLQVQLQFKNYIRSITQSSRWKTGCLEQIHQTFGPIVNAWPNYNFISKTKWINLFLRVKYQSSGLSLTQPILCWSKKPHQWRVKYRSG